LHFLLSKNEQITLESKDFYLFLDNFVYKKLK
jgi:hypothetical protein